MSSYLFLVACGIIVAVVLVIWIVLSFFYKVPKELDRIANSLESINKYLGDRDLKSDNEGNTN